MRKRVLSLSTILLLPVIVIAQFGFSIVSDPTQEAHSWQQLLNDIQKINQLIATYNQITNLYTQIQYEGQWFASRGIWLGVPTQIVNSNTLSRFGETATWNEAANVGVNIPGAYGQATYAMNPPGFYGDYPIGQSLMSALMASVEIADGANPAALLSIANSRLNQPGNDSALTKLEGTSQDTSLGTNSEVEQLNLANGGIVLLNRQIEDLNAVTTTQAEQQIVANKIQRDNLADAVNFYGFVDLAGVSVWGNSALTIQSW